MQALSSGPVVAPGTPISKYLEKDLQSELKDAKKKIEHFQADVEMLKGTVAELEKESAEAKVGFKEPIYDGATQFYKGLKKPIIITSIPEKNL